MTPNPFDSIKGLNLSIVRRAADMLGLHFGPITVSDAGKRSFGVFVLHVQCAWRFERGAYTITGRDDLWKYAGPGERPKNWSYEDHQSLQDKKLNQVLGQYQHERGGGWFNEGGDFEVTDVVCNELGDVKITLSGGYTFSMFPAGNVEAWRVFGPGKTERHVVFPPTAKGH
jgi:hypothetical protein